MSNFVFKGDPASKNILDLFSPAWLAAHETHKEVNLADSDLIVYAYTRYSTDEQNENSTHRQKTETAAWVNRNLQGRQISKFFCDEGKSGRYMAGRAQLLDLLDHVERRAFHVLVIEDTSRLSRNLGNMTSMWQLMRSRGIRVISTRQGELDLLTMAITGAFAEVERNSMLDRMKKGKKAAVEINHRYIVGPKAYGYRAKVGGPPGEIEKDPETEWVVRKIFLLYSFGFTRRQICDYFNELGVPAPGGGKWYIGTIGRSLKHGGGILGNPLYKGSVVYGKREKETDPITLKTRSWFRDPKDWATCERPDLRIVPVRRWDRCQELLLSDLKVNGKTTSKHSYLLGDALYCACGEPIVSRVNELDPYACCLGSVSDRIDRPRIQCGDFSSLHLRHIEKGVVTILKDVLARPDIGRVFAQEHDRALSKMLEAKQSERRSISLEIEATQERVDEALSIQAVYRKQNQPWDVIEGMAATCVRHSARLIELKNRLATIPSKIISMKVNSPEIISLHSLLDEFTTLNAAFRPTISRERENVALLRRFVRRVEVKRAKGAMAGEVALYIDWTGEGYSDDNNEEVAALEVVKGSFDITHRVRERPPLLSQSVEDVVSKYGIEILSDADYELCSDVITRQMTRSRYGNFTIKGRKLLNVALFMARLEQPFAQLPLEFGEKRKVVGAVRVLVYRGGLDEAVKRLRDAGSPSVEAISLDCFTKFPRARRLA